MGTIKQNGNISKFTNLCRTKNCHNPLWDYDSLYVIIYLVFVWFWLMAHIVFPSYSKGNTASASLPNNLHIRKIVRLNFDLSLSYTCHFSQNQTIKKRLLQPYSYNSPVSLCALIFLNEMLIFVTIILCYKPITNISYSLDIIKRSYMSYLTPQTLY